MTLAGNWRERERGRGDVDGVAAASIGAISDPILLSLPSLRRIHVSDFETHGGGGDDEVASGFGGGHFGLAVKSALPSAHPRPLPLSLLPSFLSLPFSFGNMTSHIST